MWGYYLYFTSSNLFESTNSLVSLAPTRKKHQLPECSNIDWMEAPTSTYTSTNLHIEKSVFSQAPPCHPVFLATTRWKLQLPIFKHQLEYQRTTVLPSTTLPPWLWISDWKTNNTGVSILTPSFLFCNSSLLQKQFCNSALLHAILQLFSSFYLFNNCYSSLSFISSSATFNFTLLIVHHIFPIGTTNVAQWLHIFFYSHMPHQLHLESSWAKMPQQLNHQLIKNHESIFLTES